MYRKKLMRVCLTGVMVVSIATANVAPVFAAEPVEKVETESDSWDSISGEINFRDTDNNESIFVQFNNEKVEDCIRSVDLLEDKGDLLFADTTRKLFSSGMDPIEVIQWKSIYDRMEKACDACEEVGHLVESMSMKYV